MFVAPESSGFLDAHGTVLLVMGQTFGVQGISSSEPQPPESQARSKMTLGTALLSSGECDAMEICEVCFGQAGSCPGTAPPINVFKRDRSPSFHALINWRPRSLRLTA